MQAQFGDQPPGSSRFTRVVLRVTFSPPAEAARRIDESFDWL